MKIFTNDGLRRIGDRTVEKDNIMMLDLIERAASAVSYELISRWRTSKRFVIFAGPGDNGADALAVARMMYEQGYRPDVYLFNIKSAQLSPCCLANRDRLLETVGDDINFIEVIQTFDPPVLDETDVVVDGLFGNGLRTPLKGGYTALVQYINSSGAYVVSIDIPSGMFGEWNMGNDRRNIIRANLTLTYQSKRLAFYFSENADCVGECKVLDIELDQESMARTPTDFYLIEREDVHEVMRPRNPFVNKYDNGTLLLIAGSYGMAGAAVLATKACLRSGVGKVIVHTPRRNNDILQISVPEAVMSIDHDEKYFSETIDAEDIDAVCMGPGLRQQENTAIALISQVRRSQCPIVLDADALNILSNHRAWLQQLPKNIIMTPHPKEFDRLNGASCADSFERLSRARDLAEHLNAYIILKGHYSALCMPNGHVVFNSTGNAGMATAGSGDVLSGIITGLLARGYQHGDACIMGMYLHGVAGDLAAKELGMESMVASDIIKYLPKAFRRIND